MTSFAFRSLSFILVTPLVTALAFGQKPVLDPGHKSFADLRGLRVSVPNQYSVVGPAADSGVLLMRHDEYKHVVFVALRGDTETDAFLDGVITQLLNAGFDEPSSEYSWKVLPGHRVVSKSETGGGMLQGFNGKRRIGVKVRQLNVDGQKLATGYAWVFSGGDDRRLFEENLGGDSMSAWYGEAHVISSLTGESYDEINPVGGGIAAPPPASP